MKILATICVCLGGALVCASSGAVIPANPRTIAGFDNIQPTAVGEVLSAFCRKNGCTAKLTWRNAVWHLYVGDTHVAGIGEGCAGIPHHYCIQTIGSVAVAFMTLARTRQLARLLEAKGATVVLMDCSIEPTSHGLGYICTNGKPPP